MKYSNLDLSNISPSNITRLEILQRTKTILSL